MDESDRRRLLGTAAAAGATACGAVRPAVAGQIPGSKEASGMTFFKAPMINLYSRDLSRAMAFYARLGFAETFRTPASGPPAHVELRLDGFTLGIASVEAARDVHGLHPKGDGRWIEIVLWTDDTDSAVRTLTATGAPLLSAAHDFLEGRLRSAWIADPDGNPIQLVQRKRED